MAPSLRDLFKDSDQQICNNVEAIQAQIFWAVMPFSVVVGY